MPHPSAVRVRFAPSPTGYLHVGGLRTALYNALFAKKHGGIFVLRIEDTDRSRFVPGAVESLVESLKKTGLMPDEGVGMDEKGNIVQTGGFGPYIQSERLSLYKKHAEELVMNGRAYYCFCSSERLAILREEQVKNKQAPKYDKRCLSLSSTEREERRQRGETSVIRLDVPLDRGAIVFDDAIRGEVSIHARDVDDQVLMKSDGFPTYHLANVIDDRLMGITHVIRGEEWLPSTPKHILLYEAFGWEMPVFAHIPLLLNSDKSKLSKRQGDVAVEDYLAKGYLPEALVNFVALLGWNPGRGSTKEIFSFDELTHAFDLEGVHKTGAVFDQGKLDWMNGEYIKALPIDMLYERALEGGFLNKNLISNAPAHIREEEYLRRVLAIEQERLTKLADIGEENPFFFIEPVCQKDMLPWKKSTIAGAMEALEQAILILEGINQENWTREYIGEALLAAAGDKRGDFLWPIRVALTGAEKSPPPQDIAWVIGKDAAKKRIRLALSILNM